MADENESRWAKLVEDFKVSGLTQREFARERGISFGSFRNWFYRIQRETQRNGGSSERRVSKQAPSRKDLRLIPIEVVASAPYGAAKRDRFGALELVLASGSRLLFPAGTDIDYLRALVAWL
jgi:transposase-like protein